MSSSIGYFQNSWVPRDSIRISIDDAGFRTGATAVERLRTYRQAAFELDSHLTRLSETLRVLGITGLPSQVEISALVQELLARNTLWLASQPNKDSGITIFATPGELGSNNATFAMHLSAIDHERVERFQTLGQPLVISHVTQQPESTWPRRIKVRSRLHYYLADSLAKEVDRDAVAVLVDDDGSVTETSIANLAIVHDGAIHSPSPEQVLGGVTQSVVKRLAESSGLTWHHRRLSPQDLRQADDVLLMGTDSGLWFANCIDHTPLSKSGMSNVFRTLIAAFKQRTSGGIGCSVDDLV